MSSEAKNLSFLGSETLGPNNLEHPPLHPASSNDGNLVKVDPLLNITPFCIPIPSSKPESQRAILIGSLSKGISKIRNVLFSRETNLMIEVCRLFGADISVSGSDITVVGRELPLLAPTRVFDCQGSALVARVSLALSSFAERPITISGDNTLRKRPMRPLITTLEKLGAQFEKLDGEFELPIQNLARPLEGGSCEIPGNISSQFITSILLASPFAKKTTSLHVTGQCYSGSYIRQTLEALRRASVSVEYADDLSRFCIEPARYLSFEFDCGADWTSASYPLAILALFPGEMTLSNIESKSLQGERAILDFLEEMGFKYSFDETSSSLNLVNANEELCGDFFFDVSDCPNIVPTLATIGAYVNGSVTVVGAALSEFHKAPRVSAMIDQLGRLGVDISPVFVNSSNIIDGFRIRGKNRYEGGVTLTSEGDHRIFLALFIAALRTRKGCVIEGYNEAGLSYPDFLVHARKLGASFHEVSFED